LLKPNQKAFERIELFEYSESYTGCIYSIFVVDIIDNKDYWMNSTVKVTK